MTFAEGLGSRLDSHVNRILFSLPLRLRWRARAVRLFLRFFLRTRVSVYRLRGPASPSGRHAVLVVAGGGPGVDYLPERFFKAPPEREFVGRASVRALPRLLRQVRSSADLTIIRADRISARIWFRHGYLRAPEWIGTQVSLGNPSLASAWKSKSVREDLRRMRRQRLCCAESHDPADFAHFYENMYGPYVRARFGELGGISPARYLRHAFLRGGLLFVEQDGRRLAGMLFTRMGKTLKFVKMGTRNGQQAPVRMGALAALYVFGIEQAEKLGCTRVDFGGCRSLLQDGVLRFKSKWGARIGDDVLNPFHCLISWNRLNRVVADFFRHSSLIFYDKGGFSAICALSRDNNSADNPLLMRPSIKGLRNLYLVGGGAGIPECYPGTDVTPITAASKPGRFESVFRGETPCC